MQRRSFLGHIFRGAGAALGTTQLSFLDTSPQRPSADNQPTATLTVYADHDRRFVFPDVPLDFNEATGVIELPECRVERQAFDYTAHQVTARLPILGKSLEIPFGAFEAVHVNPGNTLTFVDLQITLRRVTG